MVKFELPERLDVTTSPEIEKQLLDIVNNDKPETLVCCFANTNYVSSAGLRVMLLISKKIAASGAKFTLTGMDEAVYNIFDLSGFSGILDIQESVEIS